MSSMVMVMVEVYIAASPYRIVSLFCQRAGWGDGPHPGLTVLLMARLEKFLDV